ncbi:hypothetical protein C2845_PM18G08970 [Panicum miliaceum]|uniref:Uncharacterized protein n=1 Tax=Panicum miliaceum TaxID=4540 RepID=A0A3L6PJE6_PANMI|nr:hypothetical protein C2845_PM18G08970 [Panicum miliaceum]
MPCHGLAGQSESYINREVLKFLGVDYAGRAAGSGPGLTGLHPLDLYRRSLLSNLHHHKRQAPYPSSSVGVAARAAPRSAQRLYSRRWLLWASIDLDGRAPTCRYIGSGRIPLRILTCSWRRASGSAPAPASSFEALLGATGNDVTAFVLFMRDMADSPGDVALLAREGILWHDLAGGEPDVAKTGESRLCAVAWATVALTVSIFFLIADVMQIA